MLIQCLIFTRKTRDNAHVVKLNSKGGYRRNEGFTLLMARPTATQLYKTWVIPRTNRKRWSCSRPSYETNGSRPCATGKRHQQCHELVTFKLFDHFKTSRTLLPHRIGETHGWYLILLEGYLSRWEKRRGFRDEHSFWCCTLPRNKHRSDCWKEMNLRISRKSIVHIVPKAKI